MENTAELLWQRIFEKGRKEENDFINKLHLNPKATEEDFLKLEKTLSTIIPDEMKSFYSVYNGQKWRKGTKCAIRNLTLMPIEEIIAKWNFLNDEFDPNDGLKLENDECIKPFLWNPKWIPIAENGGGDYVCLDTDPTEKGTFGQVLYFYHDWGNRSVDAKCLFEFIEQCLIED